MAQEDKELLLKDLSARLPYGVILRVTLKDKYDEIANRDITLSSYNITYITSPSHWKAYKPYLRPMSSMTEEELEEYRGIAPGIVIEDGIRLPNTHQVDWLNAHHFDYHGLIEKGLALKASKGMYENNN